MEEEEASGSAARFSLFWRRDELRRLRRLRRRVCGDPLLSKLLLRAGTVPARQPAALREPVREGKRLLGTAATLWRGEARRNMYSRLSFWKRIVGFAIAVAVILLLTWATFNPPRLAHLEPCPDDWLYYKRKCYYHSGAIAAWNSAQEFCAASGASLAVIDNHQELIFIMYRIRITDIWIGLRKKGSKFFWVNGEPFDTNLFPINTTNGGNCVQITSTFISTRRCSSPRNWLCTISQYNPKTRIL